MNNPSPLIPQGSLLEQKNKSRARVKVAFFTVVGIHVAAIVIALLAQGCKRDQTPPVDTQQPQVPADTNMPPLDTNAIPGGVVASNAVAVPTPVPEPVPVPVPVPVPTTQEYVVLKGDSFSAIAKKFPGVTVKAIQAANPTVNPSKLQINQKIVIPAASAAAPSPVPGVAPVVEGGERIYIVKAGDSLIKIAKEQGTTVPALRKANKLTTDKIKVGDKMKIPVSAAPPSVTAPVPAPAPVAPVTATAPGTPPR